jgi:hypothetical protein
MAIHGSDGLKYDGRAAFFPIAATATARKNSDGALYGGGGVGVRLTTA